MVCRSTCSSQLDARYEGLGPHHALHKRATSDAMAADRTGREEKGAALSAGPHMSLSTDSTVSDPVISCS